jgi:hypothetical protein
MDVISCETGVGVQYSEMMTRKSANSTIGGKINSTSCLILPDTLTISQNKQSGKRFASLFFDEPLLSIDKIFQ